MARVTLARETFLSECRAVTLGVFLFFSFVFFILCVTSFFRVLLKIKKEKVKIITTHTTNTFLLVPYKVVLLREKKRTRKASKSRGIGGWCALLLHVRTTDFYRRRVCDLRRTFRVTLQQD